MASPERERVLKLLEDGKITADQAARLLEALGRGGAKREESERWAHHRPHPPRPPRAVRVKMAELDRIPDIVAGAVSSAMRSGFGPQGALKQEFSGKSSLFLKSVSGDVNIESWDNDSISFASTGGITKVREREDNVMIRSISGDIKARVPSEARLELVSVSGDIKVSDCSGSFGLKNVSGDVDLVDFTGVIHASVVSGDFNLLRVSGELAVETKSGDIMLEPSGAFSGSMVSKSGDIELALSPDADVVLDIEIEEAGEIAVDLDFAYETLEEGDTSLKLKLGAGTRELKIRTRESDVKLRQVEEG